MISPLCSNLESLGATVLILLSEPRTALAVIRALCLPCELGRHLAGRWGLQAGDTCNLRSFWAADAQRSSRHWVWSYLPQTVTCPCSLTGGFWSKFFSSVNKSCFVVQVFSWCSSAMERFCHVLSLMICASTWQNDLSCGSFFAMHVMVDWLMSISAAVWMVLRCMPLWPACEHMSLLTSLMMVSVVRALFSHLLHAYRSTFNPVSSMLWHTVCTELSFQCFLGYALTKISFVPRPFSCKVCISILSQGAYNSGKPGNLREFINSGNLKYTQRIFAYQIQFFFAMQSETHSKPTCKFVHL